MNALINACLKPTPSTLLLATNEIKKLHHWNFYLKADAANAFWSIPLDDEFRRMTAYQTHEGIFVWDHLTMGTRPASTVQQSAYYPYSTSPSMTFPHSLTPTPLPPVPPLISTARI